MNKLLTTGLIVLSTSSLAFTDRAEVLSVDEVLKTQIYQTPYEECRSEEVPVYSQQPNDSYTDEIFGGILGGVIGNQLGGGRGNKVATVAGTLLGASIASDNSRSSGTRIVSYRQVQRCETKYKQERKESIDYYLVTAKYNNKEFTFKTDTQPGSTVKVTVSPNN
jgi:uncharacterized protein YcfJ